jgi:hypothetical protein
LIRSTAPAIHLLNQTAMQSLLAVFFVWRGISESDHVFAVYIAQRGRDIGREFQC